MGKINAIGSSANGLISAWDLFLSFTYRFFFFFFLYHLCPSFTVSFIVYFQLFYVFNLFICFYFIFLFRPNISRVCDEQETKVKEKNEEEGFERRHRFLFCSCRHFRRTDFSQVCLSVESPISAFFFLIVPLLFITTAGICLNFFLHPFRHSLLTFFFLAVFFSFLSFTYFILTPQCLTPYTRV